MDKLKGGRDLMNFWIGGTVDFDLDPIDCGAGSLCIYFD